MVVDMRARLERYANRLWYQTARPAWPWRMLSALHQALLGGRWQRPAGWPPVPVIVVGNLAVGGCGKTPTVIALARHLAAAGLRAGIISRGYRRRGGGRHPIPVGPDSDPDRCGDEPVLLAQGTGLPVWVGRDRAAALNAAVTAGVEVVLADDGLQHSGLARSFEIALVDARRRFGNGRLLPAGPLRQPAERLAQVDAVLYRTPADGLDSLDGPTIDPTRCFHLQAEALLRLSDGERLAPDALAGQAVSALCGIADPDQFGATLQALGQRPVVHAFPDHHRFAQADLDGIPEPIVTTAKDAVKLRRLARLPEALHVLEVSAILPAGLLQAVDAHVQQFQP
ncbi:MAG: tetraacyldisaccharide 4'-kinase [Wenzhouxiangella sp.]